MNHLNCLIKRRHLLTFSLLVFTNIFGNFLYGSERQYKADYVVVGMGAAGAGVAKLLSDNGKTSVIGIEAGGNHDHDEAIKNSTYAPILESDYFPQYFYQMQQVVQPAAEKNDFNYTTGRLFGGGSSINGEQYVRGSPQLYENWETSLGRKWSVQSIEETFKSLETYNGSTLNPSERGFSGPVNIRQAPVIPTTMATKFVNATALATGFDEILDYNLPETPMGPFTRWQLFQKPNGNRESSSTAYLEPIIERKKGDNCKRKLKIFDKTTVLRVVFDGNKAIGVKVLKNGKYATVYARKKVILCAGVYSPWILQASGIGPKQQLKAAGINVIYDNPNVGRNLINQLISVAMFNANPNDIGVPVDDPNALYVGGAFLPDPTLDQTRRGVQLIGISPGSGQFAIAMILLQPKSRGNVIVQSEDPLQVPMVDDGALTNPDDLASFVGTYKVYIKGIAEQLQIIDETYSLVSPPMEVIDDDQALEEYILSTIDHTHHWAGTCRMAPLDQGGVVDHHGNVFGVKNLVVADDSIAPFIPDGNTAACAFMIGKKIAEDIIQQSR